MAKSNRETREEVMKVLLDRFNKKGSNFFFRSRHIKLENKSVWVVGMALGDLEREGKIILWNSYTTKSTKLYKTKFIKT